MELAEYKEALTGAERKIVTLRKQGSSAAQTSNLLPNSIGLSLKHNDLLRSELDKAYNLFVKIVAATELLITSNYRRNRQIENHAEQIRQPQELLEISKQNCVDLEAEHRECFVKTSHKQL